MSSLSVKKKKRQQGLQSNLNICVLPGIKITADKLEAYFSSELNVCRSPSKTRQSEEPSDGVKVEIAKLDVSEKQIRSICAAPVSH